jgi:uridine phosphorylase
VADERILTPERVLALRAVDTTAIRFDVAVFCFRGPRASRLLLETLDAREVKGRVLYGVKCHEAKVGRLQVAALPHVIWGGPVTAILLEELACLGVRMAIGMGAAGSLVSEAQIGCLFIPERAAGRDGTSREYPREYRREGWATANPELLSRAQRLAEEDGASPLGGSVWTTDALFEERPSKVRAWREAGADYVNLECGTFYAVAAAVGMQAVYLGLVTDYVSREQPWREGFWGRESLTDPIIARVVRRLIEEAAMESGAEDV